jgi:hypothetical protein
VVRLGPFSYLIKWYWSTCNMLIGEDKVKISVKVVKTEDRMPA